MGSCFGKTKKSAPPLPSKTANIAPLRQHTTEKGESFRRVTEMSAISMPDLKQAKEEELIQKVVVTINPIAELVEAKEGQKGGAEMDGGLPPQTLAIAVLKQQEKKEEEKKEEIEKDEWLQISTIAGLRQDDKHEDERRGMEKCEMFPTLAIADLKQEEKEKRWGMEKCKLLQTSAIADLKQEDNEEEGRGGTKKCELLPTLAIADNQQEEERVGTDKGELLRTSATADLKQELQEEEEEEEEKEMGELAGRVVIAITATDDLEEAKEDDRMEKEKWLRVVAMTHHKVEAKEEHPKEKMEDGQSSQKPAIAEESQEKSEEKAIVKEHERSLGNFMENSEYFSEKMFRSARFESAKERLPSIIHRRIPSMESLLLFDTDENEPSQQTCSSLLVLQTLADLISKSNGRNSNEEEEEEEDTDCDWPRQRNKSPEETKEAARGLQRENEGHGDFTFAANHSRSIKGKESVQNQSSWRVINDPWRHSTEDDIVLEEIRSDDSMNEEEEEEEENGHTNAPLPHHRLHPYPHHHHQHHHHHLHEEDDHQVLLPNLSLDDIILLLEKDELDQHLLSFLVSSKSSCHASDAASEASFEFKIGGSVGSTPQSTPSTPMLSAGSTPRKICQLNSMALTQDEISEIWGLFESRQSNGSCSTSNVLPPTYC